MLNFFFLVVIGLIFVLPALRNLKQGRYKSAGIFPLLGLAALAVLYVGSDVYLTSLWYDDLGYASRYWKVLFLRAELFLAGGFVALSLGIANVFFWYHGAQPPGQSLVRESRSKLILLAGLLLQIPVFIAAGAISSAHWNQRYYHAYVPISRAYCRLLDGKALYFCSETCWEGYRKEKKDAEGHE